MKKTNETIAPEVVIRMLAYGILAGIAVVTIYSAQALFALPAAKPSSPAMTAPAMPAAAATKTGPAVPQASADKPGQAEKTAPAKAQPPEATQPPEARQPETAPAPKPAAAARVTREPEAAAGSSREGKAMAILGTGLLLSGSALLGGAFLGFLFGIPRSLQQQGAVEAGSAEGASSRAAYGANTSLEQISDWLTKILVGVSLTQLSSLPSTLTQFAEFAGPGLGGFETSRVFAVALLIYFLTCGFLMSYLWTRLRLGKAFSEADALAAIRGEIETAVMSEVQKKAQGQMTVDYEALRLAEKQLESGDVPQEELDRAFRGTSDLYRTHIYQLALNLRRDNWKKNKPRMARTIPVFRALIATDEKKPPYHQNYGQLGYALAESDPPDYKNALAALDKAIELRGPAKEQGYLMYEFVRAKCLADLSATDPKTKDRVIEDLRVAFHWPEMEGYARGDERLADWLKAAHVTLKSLLPD